MSRPATLTLTFEDGSSKQIDVHVAIEIDVSPERKQSIEFRQSSNGKWVMSFTKPIFEGKRIESIAFVK